MTISGERATGTGAATHLADHVALHAQHNAIAAVADGQVLVKSGGTVVGDGAPVTAGDLVDFLTADDLTAIVYTTTITGNGTTPSWTITHNLGSGDVVVRVRSAASGTSFAEGADFDVEQTSVAIVDVNSLTITPEVVVPSGHVWRVTVWAVDLLNGLIGGTLTDGGGTVDQTDIDASITAHNAAVAAHPLTSAAAAISSNVVTYNLATAKTFTTTLSENVTTLNVTNEATVDQARIVMSFSSATRTIAWPAWRWIGGVVATAPVAAGETLVVDIWTLDAGTTTYASFAIFETV